MAIVCVRPGKKGKIYLSADDCVEFIPDDKAIRQRIDELCKGTGLTVPTEPIITDAKNSCWTHLYGLTNFGNLFTRRQLLYLLTFASVVRGTETEIARCLYLQACVLAITTYLGVLLDRQSDYSSTICIWESGGEFIKSTFAQRGIPLSWDFVELAPFGEASGSPRGALDWIVGVIETISETGAPAHVQRGSAMTLPCADRFFDGVVTDPPYYDYVPYADISDFFYVWLKRSIGSLYSEHFSTEGTPKKNEIVADAVRHGKDKQKAIRAYETMMAESFKEAHRVLKPLGPMAVVYAHKTTIGWATLVDALKKGGFTVTEAWPFETERPGRVRAIESAALASSIFLVARKREGADPGYYEQVQSEMEHIVRERVETLWEMGITGADLNIAAVGAGLCAFTRFTRVEYANGEEVPTAKFLTEVEGVVLELLLEKIFKVPRSGLAAVDPASKFYVLWRFQYKHAEIDAGEAIVFAYPQGVELDGARGLTAGPRALVEKKKSKMKLKDYSERGEYEKLGLPNDEGTPAPLVDVLHRSLWLMENRPAKLNEFLDASRPDLERLRLVAQALAGPALQKKDGELGATPTPEQSALGKLTSNWRSLIEENLFRSR